MLQRHDQLGGLAAFVVILGHPLHLAPDGHVWGCCIRAESLGNVRDHDYDFKKIWLGETADAFRASVKNKECACPLANASYTNLLLDAPSLAKVAANMAGLDEVLK